MRSRKSINHATSVVAVILILFIYYTLFHHRHKDDQSFATKEERIVVVVSCGDRQSETFNLLKSAIAFNRPWQPMRFIIFTEVENVTSFQHQLEDWTKILIVDSSNAAAFQFEIRSLDFPKQNTAEWRTLFKPCAAQRLFLPSILKDIDSVLYIDTDALFLSPVDSLWSHFAQFNATQMVGLAAEHLDASAGWYNRYAKHPYYGELGVNSGVMLMNLTRLRDFRWEQSILPLFEQYKDKIVWGDQDLINILFHEHPDKLYELPCEWNYRPDQCMYDIVYRATHGVRILHGNHGTFHTAKHPLFHMAYRVIDEYMLGSNSRQNLLRALERALADATVQSSNCGRISDTLLVEARRLLK